MDNYEAMIRHGADRVETLRAQARAHGAQAATGRFRARAALASALRAAAERLDPARGTAGGSASRRLA